MNEPRSLNIPVILGTSRKGRASVHAATPPRRSAQSPGRGPQRGHRHRVGPSPVDDAGEAIKRRGVLGGRQRR